jgi:hypothetical protein
MENIFIQGTSQNPTVDLNFEQGTFRFAGRLISLASTDNKFFNPLNEKAIEYCKNPCNETKITIDLEYCSSAGLKNLFQFLKIFDRMYEEGKNVSFEWRFFKDDEDGKDKGLYFKRLLRMPVKLIMYSND